MSYLAWRWFLSIRCKLEGWIHNLEEILNYYNAEISEKMLGIMDEFNLTWVVQKPTHHNNILDLVFTTHPDLIEGTYVVPGMSDHSAVICDINFKTKPPLNPLRSVYLCKRVDMGGLQEQLRNSYTSFQASEPSTKSVKENWTQVKTILFDTIKKHIPQKTLNEKKSTPWLNSRIKCRIHQKQWCYNAARHSNSEQDWHKFKHLQKVVHNEMRKAHQNYINNLLDIGDHILIENTKPSITKHFWQYIKALNLTGRKLPIQNGRQMFVINSTTMSLQMKTLHYQLWFTVIFQTCQVLQ